MINNELRSQCCSLGDDDTGEEVAPAPGHVHCGVGPLRQNLVGSQPGLGEVHINGGALLLHRHVGVQQRLLVGGVHRELARQANKLKQRCYICFRLQLIIFTLSY